MAVPGAEHETASEHARTTTTTTTTAPRLLPGDPALVAANSLAVFGLDRDGRLAEVNHAVRQMTGFEESELVGRTFADLVAPADAERAGAAFDLVLQGVPQQLEVVVRGATGHPVELALTGVPWVVDGEIHGIYGVANDVTESNRLAQELRVTRQLATVAGQAKSDFVARISHEIRTPLTGILAAVELLADTGPDQEQQQLIATLTRSGDRLLNLVDHVLDFAAVGAEGAAPTMVEFDLHALLRDAVALAGTTARTRDVEVVLHLADDVPQRVRDHPTWTGQILDNLLSNAVAHTDHGRVELSVTTTRGATGPCLVYRVSDTGTGIDPAHHDLIFEPFTQAPSEGGRPRPGSGLGLSIVQQLVAICGGSIVLDSEPGRGSTFWVTMPARPADAPS